MKVKSFFRKHFWISMILMLLACVTVTGFVSVRTNGFDDMSGLTNVLNTANLLQQGEEGNYLFKGGKATGTDTGTLTVSFADNGAVTVRGNTEVESSSYTCEIARLTLQPGTYTLTSGMFGARSTSTRAVWISVNDVDTGEKMYDGDFGGADRNGTFTVDAETMVEIVLNVYPGKWNTTLYPVLVEGTEAGGFYA